VVQNQLGQEAHRAGFVAGFVFISILQFFEKKGVLGFAIFLAPHPWRRLEAGAAQKKMSAALLPSLVPLM
jgi:hypothetical protein